MLEPFPETRSPSKLAQKVNWEIFFSVMACCSVEKVRVNHSPWSLARLGLWLAMHQPAPTSSTDQPPPPPWSWSWMWWVSLTEEEDHTVSLSYFKPCLFPTLRLSTWDISTHWSALASQLQWKFHHGVHEFISKHCGRVSGDLSYDARAAWSQFMPLAYGNACSSWNIWEKELNPTFHQCGGSR